MIFSLVIAPFGVKVRASFNTLSPSAVRWVKKEAFRMNTKTRYVALQFGVEGGKKRLSLLYRGVAKSKRPFPPTIL